MFGRTTQPEVAAQPVNPATVRDMASMSFSELLNLKTHIEREIEHRGEKELAEVREKLFAIAAVRGLTIDDLMNPPKKRERRESKPKFVNPNDPTQTWSGRGKRPLWFKENMNAGLDEESLVTQ